MVSWVIFLVSGGSPTPPHYNVGLPLVLGEWRDYLSDYVLKPSETNGSTKHKF